MFDSVKNLFRERVTVHFDATTHMETTTVRPSPFREHVVTPVKATATRASESGIGRLVGSFCSTVGSGAKWVFTSPPRTEEENAAVLDSMDKCGLNW